MVQLMPLPPHHILLEKPRMVLPFWYWLTQVVLQKRQLNGFSVVVVKVNITAIFAEWTFVAVVLQQKYVFAK